MKFVFDINLFKESLSFVYLVISMDEKKETRIVFVRGVDAKVWDDFRAETLKKRGKLHGVLGEELSNTLRYAMSQDNKYRVR